MATIKQINANRKNALLSKGPKTDLGKLNSSKNSLNHGLTAKQLVIGEDLKEFEQFDYDNLLKISNIEKI